jgi:isopenicillin N synthase-like dioxygenase
MTTAIPVIDLEAAEAGDRAQRDAARTAAEEFGAVQVVNHGVPQDLVAELTARMTRLLSLPREEKARLASPHPYRGWRQWPDDFGRLELERFNAAQFDDIGQARKAGLAEEYLRLFAHANLWPDDDPGLREAAFGYIAASRRLAGRMLRLYAAVQGLPADAFDLGTLPHLRLTVNDYPTWTYPQREPKGRGAAWTEERGTNDEGRRRRESGPAASGEAETASDEDKLLLLEHADDSAVTVLAQQGDYEGLQIQGPGGDWIPVPLIPGALQVFSGSLLARWTGGRLRPGRHRVVAGGTVTRRSVAVFVYPALQTVVAPLAPFAAGSADEPVLVWDHIKDRVADYLAEYGRPEQIAAWRDGTPYVADLAENSAGR